MQPVVRKSAAGNRDLISGSVCLQSWGLDTSDHSQDMLNFVLGGRVLLQSRESLDRGCASNTYSLTLPLVVEVA